MVGTDAPMTDIDVQSSGTTKGERLLLKIVSAEGRLRIADLGMDAKQIEQFEALAGLNKGLIVVAGPKASGVTTTLYACLKSHDAFIQNLLTQLFSSNFQLFGKAVWRVLDAVGVTLTEDFVIKTVAFGLATVASLAWNFLTYKYWAFRPTPEARGPASR